MDTGNLNCSYKERKKARVYQVNSSDASPNKWKMNSEGVNLYKKSVVLAKNWLFSYSMAIPYLTYTLWIWTLRKRMILLYQTVVQFRMAVRGAIAWHLGWKSNKLHQAII